MKRMKVFLLAFAMCAVFFSCSDDDSDESNVSGTAAKGYVANADVNVYAYLETGARGKLLASTKTDAKGKYSVKVNHRGAAEVVVSNGTYKDEATGETVTIGSKHELRTVVILNAEKEVAAVTALTTIAAAHVDAHASAGIATAIANANARVSTAFGLSGINLTETIPSDFSYEAVTHSQAQVKYGIIQAGLSQVVKEQGLAAEKLLELIADISADYSDDSFNNSKGSVALQIALSVTPVQAMTGLNVAIENYMKGPNNHSGVASGSVSVTVPQPE
ncbi:MAG TPA: hypothetical protein VIQ51_08290 [Chryseosolibacter sp.]